MPLSNRRIFIVIAGVVGFARLMFMLTQPFCDWKSFRGLTRFSPIRFLLQPIVHYGGSLVSLGGVEFMKTAGHRFFSFARRSRLPASDVLFTTTCTSRKWQTLTNAIGGVVSGSTGTVEMKQGT